METDVLDLLVIGGGAAGFFGAIQYAEMYPSRRIAILEKSNKLLSKVKVSGGGRCNVTHHCFNPNQLADHYPRGEKFLKQLFKVFQARDMVDWLERKGVKLKVEADGRMFPISDDSQTIIDCFVTEALRRKVRIELSTPVTSIMIADPHFLVSTSTAKTYQAKRILIATGGSPKPESYSWLETIGHSVIAPIPSLFTFNDSKKQFVDLLGVSVASAAVKIVGTKFQKRGPVLLTHWGISGPAVIKLSAWAARYLHEKEYNFKVHVNWTLFEKEDDIRTLLAGARSTRLKQKIWSNPLAGLPQRLWEKLCLLSEIERDRIWGEVSNRSVNKLLENLFRCEFSIKGKTTFKEEFVTCGGIDLKDIDPETMESKRVKNLYFAGEVLNLDGETGGFNFQAAWSTAYIAARAMG